jgi:hypothetical protein
LISRLTVEGERPRDAAIKRIESPAIIPREISSRSDSVSDKLDRFLGTGRTPPVSNIIGEIDE